MVTEDVRVEGESQPAKDGSIHPPSLWIDSFFDAIKFTESYIPFPENFLSNYQGLYNKSSIELSKMAKNKLLRDLLIEQV